MMQKWCGRWSFQNDTLDLVFQFMAQTNEAYEPLDIVCTPEHKFAKKDGLDMVGPVATRQATRR